jgi:hypothetical protein
VRAELELANERNEVLRRETEAGREEITAHQATIEKLNSTIGKDRDALQRERAGFRRLAMSIDADARRIESSATWRIGRLLLVPARLLRRSPTPGPAVIQRRVHRYISAVGSEPGAVTSASTTQSPLVGITRDLEKLLATKRLRVGNLIGDRLTAFSGGSGQRADLRIGVLLDELKGDTGADNQKTITSLRKVVLELKALEGSRRWRIGQWVGDIVSLGR